MRTNTQYSPTRSHVQNTIHNIRNWFRLLLKCWWIIFLAGFLAGVLGYWVAYTDRAKYTSHLTFALDDGKGGMGGAISLAAEFGFNVGGGSNIFEGDNILTLLTSRRIIENVLLEVDTIGGKPMRMITYYQKISKDPKEKTTPSNSLTAAQKRLSEVYFPTDVSRDKFSYLQDSVLLNVYKEFAVGGLLKIDKPDKKLNLYEVSVSSFDERFSKIFTDLLIKEATDFYVEFRTKKSKETLEILEARVAQNRGSLNSAITNRASLQDANVNPVFQQAQAQLQQKQVDVSTYGAAYGELYKNLELARFEYLKNIPLLQIIDAADYPMERLKKGKLKTAVTYCFFTGFFIILILTFIHIIKSELLGKTNSENDIKNQILTQVSA